MSEQMMTDPLNEEESWDSDWNGQECDVNLLEPLVEISDNPKDKSKKRKKKTSNGESRKRGRSSLKDKNVVSVPAESIFVDVSIKQEPQESEPLSLQDASLSGDPVATIPVGNSASPLPVYRVDTGDMNAFTHQLMLPPHAGNDSVKNTKKRRGRKNNKTKEVNANTATSIKQEDDEMANVFVMPFGADIETTNDLTSEKSSSQSQVNECPSTEETTTTTTTKDRTAAITSNIGVPSSSTNRKLRDLTFKLVELNNKNLQCDSRIEKIKDEFKKRLQVAEIEKKGIEQEIDKVLATIQKWKNAKEQPV